MCAQSRTNTSALVPMLPSRRSKPGRSEVRWSRILREASEVLLYAGAAVGDTNPKGKSGTVVVIGCNLHLLHPMAFLTIACRSSALRTATNSVTSCFPSS